MKDNRVLIGRLVPGDPTHLFPNENYEKIFLRKEESTSIEVPEDTANVLSFGTRLALFPVLKKSDWLRH